MLNNSLEWKELYNMYKKIKKKLKIIKIFKHIKINLMNYMKTILMKNINICFKRILGV